MIKHEVWPWQSWNRDIDPGVRLLCSSVQDCTSPIKPYDHSSTSQHNQRPNTFQCLLPLFTFEDPNDESIRLWGATDTVMLEAFSMDFGCRSVITQEHGWLCFGWVLLRGHSSSTSALRTSFVCRYIANCNHLMDQITRMACPASESKNSACFGLFICVKTATRQITNEEPQGFAI